MDKNSQRPFDREVEREGRSKEVQTVSGLLSQLVLVKGLSLAQQQTDSHLSIEMLRLPEIDTREPVTT